MHIFRATILAILTLCTSIGFCDGPAFYDVRYDVTLQPASGYAHVSIRIPNASALKDLTFSITPDTHSHIEANGKLDLQGSHALWRPPQAEAQLNLRVKIDHQRSNGLYDAMMMADWAIFRGDDLIPPVTVKTIGKAQSRSYLSFTLPSTWQSVETGWQRDKQAHTEKHQVNAPHFMINNPERRFDRPTGWMIAGTLGTRRAQLGDTTVSVSAPKNSEFRRMDVLTFLNFIWPEAKKAFVNMPEKLLIVGGDKPMWRGGLSASNSLFIHADRPLVSENGTSTLLHEVTHMITRIRGGENDDWIAEGIAEFYAIELLYRSGGMTEKRRDIVKEKLRKWSKDVKSLRIKRSSGPVTAKATLLFYQLDEEIRQSTNQTRSLNSLTQKLMEKRKVSLGDLQTICHETINKPCESISRVR